MSNEAPSLRSVGMFILGLAAVAVALAAGLWTVHVLTSAPDAFSAIALLLLGYFLLVVAIAVVCLVVRILGLPVLAAFKAASAIKRHRAAR